MRYNRVHVILFLTPIVLIVLLMYGMMAWTVGLSLTDSVGKAPAWEKFSGLKNYGILISGMLKDRFWTNLQNNVTWLVVFIIPSATLAWLWLRRKTK